MGDNSPERKKGCGLISAVFGRRRRGGFEEDATFVGSSSSNATNSTPRSVSKHSSNSQKPNAVVNQNYQRQNPSQTSMAMTSPGTRGVSKVSPTQTQSHVNQGRKLPKEAIGISGELESMISDYQKSKGSSTLVRASSSNFMLSGNLGNLRQGGAGGNTNSHNANLSNERYTKHSMENAGNRSKEVKPSKELQSGGSLCRALSTRMDPEQLKILGNEDYKNGRFAEALALYDAAISIDPNKASYRSNRSAALTALGRLLEAVFECREAIRIESHYQRAHHRLGNLYVRLGETDKALYHYKHAGPEADPDEIAKVKNLQVHLNKCTEARRLGDWNTLITETNNTISSGADSAPQIFALQAEALLKLRRHQDADKVMSKSPNFEVEECTKFFGPIGNANLLVTRAQVDLAAGRFEDALEAAQRATRLDSNNREAYKVLRKARAVTGARSKGNDLFKASRFTEACVAYGEGLEHDPYNSVLLCNRAACRSKLGQFERAVEDCSAALNLRPSYSKARLRRADCNAKLERWEASIQDYEILLKETPEDEEVIRALKEAQAQLKKRQGEEVKHVKNGGHS